VVDSALESNEKWGLSLSAIDSRRPDFHL
jgi:hypothetical protein